MWNKRVWIESARGTFKLDGGAGKKRPCDNLLSLETAERMEERMEANEVAT
jgi:hypothetical protein